MKEFNDGCRKVKKACFIASSGGHWEELMCLKEIADEYDTFYVTEEGGQAEDSNLKKIYILTLILLAYSNNGGFDSVSFLRICKNPRH